MIRFFQVERWLAACLVSWLVSSLFGWLNVKRYCWLVYQWVSRFELSQINYHLVFLILHFFLPILHISPLNVVVTKNAKCHDNRSRYFLPNKYTALIFLILIFWQTKFA